MKKTVLTAAIFLTFVSGSPQNKPLTQTEVHVPSEVDIIIKLQELDHVIDSASRILDEKGI